MIVLKIQVISDLHLSQNRKREKQNLPISFYIFFTQIKDILTQNPDIIVINGDLINNQQKLDITVLNFLSSTFSYINKQNPNIKIFINQGNHDIVHINKEIQSYGSFVNIFKNSNNVIPILSNKKISITNDLDFYFLPYTHNVDDIYSFIDQNPTHKYSLYFLHQNIDRINNLYFKMTLNVQENSIFSNSQKKKLINFNQLVECINKSNNQDYQIIEGHYHYHYTNKKHKLLVVGSLSQNTFSEKIKTLKNLNKYFGWVMIDYTNKNKVDYSFIPFKSGIVSLQYENEQLFLDEYNELVNLINEKKDLFYFQIRIKGESNNDVKKQCENLMIYDNVLESKYIENYQSLWDNQEDVPTESVDKSFNIKEYFVTEIKKIIQEDKIDRVLKEFDYITN